MTAQEPSRLPLRGWGVELARRWNSGSYSLFVLHGNIFDVYPVGRPDAAEFVPLNAFLARRIFPERAFLLFYDIGDGLTFGTPEMQKRFFAWLEVYDQVEHTSYHRDGPPRDFVTLAPVLKRFFQRLGEENAQGVRLVIDFAEKIAPAAQDAYASPEERMALVTLLKWAAASDMRRNDVGILLVTESAAKLNADLLQNPHVAQVKLELPDAEDRLLFLRSTDTAALTGGKPATEWSDFTLEDLAARLSGLNLLRIQHLLAEAIRGASGQSRSESTGESQGLPPSAERGDGRGDSQGAGGARNGRVTIDHVAGQKKRLIEEYCQGLVRFKNPKPGQNLDVVATHTAAKAKLRELAWLIRNEKRDVLERGVLLPGRVGVGKSFLVDCFASECGLPVLEIGEFRSKWVGDTEVQQARILMTIRALGPVIVVVDEADAVFGSREAADTDSGVSGRVFAAFAAHIGDATLRGRELWIAMTSRPDLLAIDMKRQGRFGLSVPLFAAQNPDEVVELFSVVARTKKIALSKETLDYVRGELGARALTGSDVESIVIRAKERAVLAKRDDDVRREDVQGAVESFIDPLDPNLIALQELAAVLACSDRRYLPARFRDADRAALGEEFRKRALLLGRR
jgi:AAA+ superfamily predicted ATPase